MIINLMSYGNEFSNILFDSGGMNNYVTGGWWNEYGVQYTGSAMDLRNASSVQSYGGWARTGKKINLGGISKIYVHFEHYNLINTIAINSEISDSNIVAKATTGGDTAVLDVSAYDDSYYIFVICGPLPSQYGGQICSGTIDKIWME